MSAAKKRPKKGRWIAIAAVAVVLIGGAAVWALRPAVQKYESVTAKTGTITTYYSFSGNVEARYRQTVISDKFMQIADVKVEEGDRVEEGDELFRTTAGERVKATIDGEVANLDVEEDERVAAGVRLLEVIDYDALEVKVKVDEYDVDAIKKGEEATIFISATGKEVKGKVNDVSRAGEVADGVTFFTATIGLDKDETLRIGMSAEVRLVGDSVKDAVTLRQAGEGRDRRRAERRHDGRGEKGTDRGRHCALQKAGAHRPDGFSRFQPGPGQRRRLGWMRY